MAVAPTLASRRVEPPCDPFEVLLSMFRTRIVLPYALALLVCAGAAAPASADAAKKIGPLAKQRSALVTGTSRVIIRAVDEASASSVASVVHMAGGHVRRSLPIIDGFVV